jgi:pilus assembly protein CpaE
MATLAIAHSVNTAARQAVFCVGNEARTVEVAAEVAASLPGFFFAGAFADYITAEKRPQFPASMKTASVCVALIDFDRDPVLALRTVERLGHIFARKISMVAVGTNLPAPLLLQAIRAGCVEYLDRPIDPVELTHALRRFEQFMSVAPPEGNSTGRVMAFFGAKGGVGNTTLAVHLATHLALTHKRKTLLIDHKHQLGHVALYLGLQNTIYHFDELLRNVDRLDAELLSGYLLQHSSGLHVLASPDYSSEQYVCHQDELERVMDFLRREYDYILIDSSVVYESAHSSIIDQADDVFLVSTADVASLRDLARLVEHIHTRPANEGKLQLAINRSTSNESITPQQIRDAVRTAVHYSVPNNFMELLQAVNNGEPISPSVDSPFNTVIATWARTICGDTDGVPAQARNTAKAKKRSLAFWR